MADPKQSTAATRTSTSQSQPTGTNKPTTTALVASALPVAVKPTTATIIASTIASQTPLSAAKPPYSLQGVPTGPAATTVTSSLASTALTVGYPPSPAHTMAQRTTLPATAVTAKSGMETGKSMSYSTPHSSAYVTSYPAYSSPMRGGLMRSGYTTSYVGYPARTVSTAGPASMVSTASSAYGKNPTILSRGGQHPIYFSVKDSAPGSTSTATSSSTSLTRGGSTTNAVPTRLSNGRYISSSGEQTAVTSGNSRLSTGSQASYNYTTTMATSRPGHMTTSSNSAPASYTTTPTGSPTHPSARARAKRSSTETATSLRPAAKRPLAGRSSSTMPMSSMTGSSLYPSSYGTTYSPVGSPYSGYGYSGAPYPGNTAYMPPNYIYTRPGTTTRAPAPLGLSLGVPGHSSLHSPTGMRTASASPSGGQPMGMASMMPSPVGAVSVSSSTKTKETGSKRGSRSASKTSGDSSAATTTSTASKAKGRASKRGRGRGRGKGRTATKTSAVKTGGKGKGKGKGKTAPTPSAKNTEPVVATPSASSSRTKHDSISKSQTGSTSNARRKREALASVSSDSSSKGPVVEPKEDDLLIPRTMPLRPVPEAAVRRVEMIAAVATLHERVTLRDKGDGRVFLKPVDLKIIPNYGKVVKTPMDLQTIGKKLEARAYTSIWQYMDDMHLMFENCLLFNKVASYHNKYALAFRAWWLPEIEKVMLEELAHHRYCCAQRRLLSAEVYRCRGGTCFIQHGSHYYLHDLGDGETVIYCTAHFNKLQDEFVLARYGNGTGGDLELAKPMFKRIKHAHNLLPEKLVDCFKCQRRDHEVCVLANPYASSPYVCKACREGWPPGVAAPLPTLLSTDPGVLLARNCGEERKLPAAIQEILRNPLQGSSAVRDPRLTDQSQGKKLKLCIKQPAPVTVAEMARMAASGARRPSQARSILGPARRIPSSTLASTSALIPATPVTTAALTALSDAPTHGTPTSTSLATMLTTTPTSLERQLAGPTTPDLSVTSPYSMGLSDPLADPLGMEFASLESMMQQSNNPLGTSDTLANPLATPDGLIDASISLLGDSPRTSHAPIGLATPAMLASQADHTRLNPSLQLSPANGNGPLRLKLKLTPDTNSPRRTLTTSTPIIPISEPIVKMELQEADLSSGLSKSRGLGGVASRPPPPVDTPPPSATGPDKGKRRRSSHVTRAAKAKSFEADKELPLTFFSSPLRAKDLPETSLSRAIYKELVSSEPAYADLITIRTVNHARETGERKPLFAKHFPDATTGFVYTRKVILAFLDLGEVDYLFYGFIIHEYGDDCPAPNTKRVYISLLDSVKMPKRILPSKARTSIYHTILRGYLRVSAERGFTHAHIFTCPPRRGQNYILPFKPPEQREICVTRLRQWYDDLLNACMFRKDPAVLDVMTLMEYLPNCEMHEMPYFDGDNWPDILEDIIRYEEDAVFEQAKRRYMTPVMDVICKAIGKKTLERPRHAAKPGVLGTTYKGQSVQTSQALKKRKKRAPVVAKVLGLKKRLNIVINNTHKDFLVVTLMDKSATFVPDPDKDVDTAQTGDEHSIVSFFKAERLEFSSLRHNRFSTMCLLHLLLSKDKHIEPHWPDAPVQQAESSRRQSMRSPRSMSHTGSPGSHTGSPLRRSSRASPSRTPLSN
eukprot:m.200708 g.200708  ORF g.200708 m.200708 type:complete len:1643 (+) comp17055_c0_seq1:162-5090(+)